MDDMNLKLWSNVTFKTQSYRKNFDFVNDGENIITEYDGIISEIKINEGKLPLIIGEYGFSLWNIELGLKFNINLDKLISEHAIEDTYLELKNVIRQKEFIINKYKKIIIIHTLVLRKEYRKCGITEEFIEMFYRDFHSKNTAIIALVKPFQNNTIDSDYYLNRKFVQVKEKIKSSEIINVSASEYYSLNELIERKDNEINEYKLFTIASNCGFRRINNSYLFLFYPEKIIERMEKKYVNYVKKET